MEKAKVVKSEIRAQLNQRSIRYNWHEPDVTALEDSWHEVTDDVQM